MKNNRACFSAHLTKEILKGTNFLDGQLPKSLFSFSLAIQSAESWEWLKVSNTLQKGPKENLKQGKGPTVGHQMNTTCPQNMCVFVFPFVCCPG